MNFFTLIKSLFPTSNVEKSVYFLIETHYISKSNISLLFKKYFFNVDTKSEFFSLQLISVLQRVTVRHKLRRYIPSMS